MADIRNFFGKRSATKASETPCSSTHADSDKPSQQVTVEKKMKGIQAHKLPAFLDEYMYRYRFGFSNGDIFNVFI